jgi:YD repeat-containing protein
MKAGDVFNGEFTLTNYGLIRADHLELVIPSDDEYFRYELLGGLPSSLAAKERITVPYRVTCLKSLDPADDGQAGGGGCSTYMRCVRIFYDFVCSNGTTSSKTIDKCWLYLHGDCEKSSGSGSPGPGGTWSFSSGSGSGTYSSRAPASKTIDGVVCWPVSKREEVIYDGTINPLKKAKEFLDDVVEIVGCSVNTATREFNDDGSDLFVKVPGGMVEVKRLFYGDQWHWEHLRNNLVFNPDSLGSGIAAVVKGGVIYEASAVDSDIFTHDTYRIVRDESGYRWEDSYGNFKAYDLDGRMTAFGSRIDAIGKLLYAPGENGRLIGVADRNDNQVLWYQYDGDNRISAIRDADHRRVEYVYSGGKLSTITDVLGNDTTYEYDSQGRIKKEWGRPLHIYI